MTKPVIGITLGDPLGIGPEIVVGALKNAEIRKLCTPLLYGKGGKNPYHALQTATEDCLSGKIDALVTAPVNKEKISRSENITFLGHTGFLEDACNQRFNTSYESTMLFVGKYERVAIATTHIPLAMVVRELSERKLKKTILNVHRALIDQFNIKAPKLAILGLNPHAGENGLIGNEEVSLIRPLIAWATHAHISLSGPFSADSYFVEKSQNYDATIALYHDQGLIPFKLKHFRESVNVTIGLPIIRTSVDHGVGYDIVGTDRANPASMIAAIKLAATFARNKEKR